MSSKHTITMEIGIIGTGRVGSTLGNSWIGAGHKVVYGVRDLKSEKAQKVLTEQQDAQVVTIDEALRSDIIVLAIPASVVEQVLKEHSSSNLSGKVIIDVTNTIPPAITSNAEKIATVTKARVAKAFNTIGFNIMADPILGEFRADGYFACDQDVRPTVEKLVLDMGLDPVYVGDLTMARHLESLGWLWISQSRVRGRDFAFKIVHRT
jgi:predicted dinucleotide-binding enzyme